MWAGHPPPLPHQRQHKIRNRNCWVQWKLIGRNTQSQEISSIQPSFEWEFRDTEGSWFGWQKTPKVQTMKNGNWFLLWLVTPTSIFYSDPHKPTATSNWFPYLLPAWFGQESELEFGIMETEIEVFCHGFLFLNHREFVDVLQIVDERKYESWNWNNNFKETIKTLLSFSNFEIKAF